MRRPALSPEAQYEIIVPGGLHVFPQMARGLEGGAAEKHRRLGDVVEALDGKLEAFCMGGVRLIAQRFFESCDVQQILGPV